MNIHPPATDDFREELQELVTASLRDELASEKTARLLELIQKDDTETLDLYLNLVFESSILLTWARHGGSKGDATGAWLQKDDQEDAAGEKREANSVSPLNAPVLPLSMTFSSPPINLLSTAYHGTVGFFSQEVPFAILMATLFMGMGGLIGSLMTVEHYTQMPGQSQPSSSDSFASNASADNTIQSEEEVKWVGRITAMVDCKWSDDKNFRPPGGNYVSLGRKYKLDSGLMEITYYTGAKVILQGPVTYEVESANGGYMSVGKLTGKVEVEKAKGFVVRTPTATVTDLGTEFGVKVNDTGAADVVVFVGKVSVADFNHHEPQLLGAGEAVHADRNEVRQIEPGPLFGQLSGQFVRANYREMSLGDDFNGPALNLAKWQTFLPMDNSRVIQNNGRIELTNRGYLITRREYHPDKLGALTIIGQWTFNDDSDALCIATRSDAFPGDSYGEVGNGLQFTLLLYGGNAALGCEPYIQRRGNDLDIVDYHQMGRLRVKSGDTFQFTIVDNGVNGLSFTLTQVSNPLNTATVTGKLSAAPVASSTGINYVVFYNRENSSGDHTAYLDNVAIIAKSLKPPPSPPPAAGGTGPAGTSGGASAPRHNTERNR